MINVCHDGHIPDLGGFTHECVDLLVSPLLSYHLSLLQQPSPSTQQRITHNHSFFTDTHTFNLHFFQPIVAISYGSFQGLETLLTHSPLLQQQFHLFHGWNIVTLLLLNLPLEYSQMLKPVNRLYVHSRFPQVMQPSYDYIYLVVQAYLPHKFLILLPTHYSSQCTKALPCISFELSAKQIHISIVYIFKQSMVNNILFELLPLLDPAIIQLYEVKLDFALEWGVVIVKLQVSQQSLCTTVLFFDELLSFQIVDGLEVSIASSQLTEINASSQANIKRSEFWFNFFLMNLFDWLMVWKMRIDVNMQIMPLYFLL